MGSLLKYFYLLVPDKICGNVTYTMKRQGFEYEDKDRCLDVSICAASCVALLATAIARNAARLTESRQEWRKKINDVTGLNGPSVT